MAKVRLGLIGCGSRGSGMMRDLPRLEDYVDLVAVCDTNTVRLELAQEEHGAQRAYTDYTELLADRDVDAVMISTPDWLHADMVIDALGAGKHVYCEKVMATTLEDINRMARAGAESDRVLYIGHNARWSGTMRKLHELVSGGAVGRVVHVWGKRFVTGSKYWHRWHRESRYSGGLLLHKGSHRMDIMNWMASSSPQRVTAMAGLNVFEHRNPPPADRCLNCDETDTCLEYLDITKGRLKEMYLDAEHEDGYIRDQCVFGPESDVYDNAVVTIEYANGVRGSYTEVHFAPISDSQSEVGVFGDRGLAIARREHVILEKRPSQEVERFEIPREQGGHGGSDFRILRDFLTTVLEGGKPLTGVEQGWDATICGLAANLSIKQGVLVAIDREARALRTGGSREPATA